MPGIKTEQRKDLHEDILLKSVLRTPVFPTVVYFRTFEVRRKAFQQIWFIYKTIFGSDFFFKHVPGNSF